MKRDVTIHDVRSACPAAKQSYDRIMNPYAFLVARPLSFYVALVLIKFGISANQVSVASFPFAVLAGFAIFLPEPFNVPAVVLTASIWLLLDCVDGNIARYNSKFHSVDGGRAGEFLDACGYYLLVGTFYIPLGLYLDDGSGAYTLCGALTSSANVLARLIHQKFLNCGGAAGDGEVPGPLLVVALNLYNQSASNIIVFAILFGLGLGRIYLMAMSALAATVLAGVCLKHFRALKSNLPSTDLAAPAPAPAPAPARQ